MKLQRLRGAIAAALLFAAPALATEQSSIVAPTTGPMNMAAFVGTYLNPALRAIQACNWGPSAPANGPGAAALPYQHWCDTTTNPVVVKFYDGTSWVTVGKLNTSTHLWTPSRQGTDLGTASIADTGTSGATLGFLNTANTWSAAQTITVTNANGLAVGRQGTTNPALKVDTSGGTGVTGIEVVAGAAGGASVIRAISSAAAENFALDAKGTGGLLLSPNSTGDITAYRAVQFGHSSTVPGAVRFVNATSGSITINPVTGALGTGVATLPTGTYTFVGDSLTQTLTNKTLASATNSLTGSFTGITGVGTLTAGATGSGFTIALTTSTVTGTLPAANFGALTGDVTNSAGSYATTIANSAVTNAKQANAAAWTIKGNFTGSSAAPQDVNISTLTNKVSPTSSDLLLIADVAASNQYKYSTIAQVVGALASGVSSIAGNTGAFTLSNGITNSTNDIRLSLTVPNQGLLAKNGSNLELQRANGRHIFINGNVELIPSSPPTLSAPATSGTLYYIYVYMSGGTMTLEASTTAYATDSTYGHKIKSGDATRTLVGMARTVSSAWVDSATQRFVRSLLNEVSKPALAQNGNNGAVSTNTRVEIDSTKRLEFLIWSGEKFSASISSNSIFSINIGSSSDLDIGFDATTAETPFRVRVGESNIGYGASTTAIKDGLSEGYHYATGTFTYQTGAANAQISANSVWLRGQIL